MPKDMRGKLKLSKSVLEMKFMKRSKMKAQAEEEAIEGSTMYSNNISEGMKNAVEKYVFEESYIPFENLIVGRLSFGGMNPEIEKLMTIPQHRPTPVNKEMDKDVSDEEMAKYSATLAQTVAKKFSNSSKRQRKKMKFLKPKEE
uniref:Putative m phase phosphoprotein 6 n=1 Tax=Triatoma dimidiata TaxID=72491 RepID=A0A0V0GCA1_TRIDM